MVPRNAALLVGLALLLAGCSSAPSGPAASPTDGTASTPQTPTATAPETVTPQTPDPTPAGTTDSPTPTVDPTTTPTADPTTTPTAGPTTTDDGYYNAFVFEARPVTPEEIARQRATAVETLSPAPKEIARAALANESTTVTVDCSPGNTPNRCSPLEDGQFLRRDGTYYRVTRAVLARTQRTGYVFDHRAYRRAPEEARSRAVPYESLSPAKRAVFRSLFARAGTVERVTGDSVYVPSEGRSANASGWLDGDPHYVSYEGHVYRLQYDGTTAQKTRLTLRYELPVVADSARAFAEPRLERLVKNVTAEDPAGPARTVILGALQDGEYEWRGTVSTRPRSVVSAEEWIRSHAEDRPALYVRWESDVYHPETDLYLLSVSERIE